MKMRIFALHFFYFKDNSPVGVRFFGGFIRDNLKILLPKPYIARNLRREKDLKVSSTGNRICLAGFEMLYWGKYKEGGRTRVKFVCPIIHSKKFRKEHPFCPWMHPQFTKGTGCFAYTQVLSEDIRKQIAYGTPKFKKIYNLRSGCERIFSRLHLTFVYKIRASEDFRLFLITVLSPTLPSF